MEELLGKLAKLRRERNAVILAHNYQPGEIQDLADFCGDSLGLSVQASKTEAERIVFCGVRFMAETAAILSPDKKVLMPELQSGCPMADMISARQVQDLKKENPGALVVCYVNSSAEVKAESDYCCTSSNAVAVVESLPAGEKVIFVPDQHLGRHVMERTGREMVLWPGYCPSHVVITVEDVERAKAEHPGAVVLTHPECSEPVKGISDELLSTGQMLEFVAESEAEEFIIATETGILHSLKKKRPGARYYAASERAVCPNMKKVSVEKIVRVLESGDNEVTVDEQVRVRAKKSLDRMVEILPKR